MASSASSLWLLRPGALVALQLDLSASVRPLRDECANQEARETRAHTVVALVNDVRLLSYVLCCADETDRSLANGHR